MKESIDELRTTFRKEMDTKLNVIQTNQKQVQTGLTTFDLSVTSVINDIKEEGSKINIACKWKYHSCHKQKDSPLCVHYISILLPGRHFHHFETRDSLSLSSSYVKTYNWCKNIVHILDKSRVLQY
jgi:hypothetical protein